MTTCWCPKCTQTREVRGGMFGRYCTACGEPLMVPAPDDAEPELEDESHCEGEVF